MHRTQIYFEEGDFEMIKVRAGARKISASAYIREVVKKELESEDHPPPGDLSAFKGLWKDRAVDVESLRREAWK
jgi:hypothetical protein